MASRRITVHADGAGGRQAYDLVVCAHTPVAELLPGLVDVVAGDAEGGVRWRLSHTMGPPLDESMSLTDNGIHDGDVAILTSDRGRVHGLLAVEPVRAIAGAGGRVSGIALVDLCWAWLMLTVSVVMSGSGSLADAGVIACCAAATCWRAVAGRRPALAVTGVTVAGAAGFTAVPSVAAAPNVLLGAAVVFAASATMSRLVREARTALTAVGSAAALAVAVAAVTAGYALPLAAAGVAMTVGGFALLTVAPRCAALFAGVQPRHAVEPPPDLLVRAEEAHSVLTGLIGGSAVATAAGAALLARDSPGLPAVAFLTVSAVLLLLRVRTHVGDPRRIALSAAAMASVTAALFVVATADPARIGWLTAGLVVILIAAAVIRPKPALTRGLDALDHLCGALLVPLACWVLGWYTVARDWTFT